MERAIDAELEDRLDIYTSLDLPSLPSEPDVIRFSVELICI